MIIFTDAEEAFDEMQLHDVNSQQIRNVKEFR